MGKRIVICCDGTGNQVDGNLSNVLKLFRILQKNDGQRVYYNPGIGTIGTDDRQLNIANYALSAYKKVGEQHDFQSAWHFTDRRPPRQLKADIQHGGHLEFS